MASTRSLPERRNELLQDPHVPLYEILVERRCHAQTDLGSSIRPGLVNTSNATKSANLYDKFDYVHLRVPLPKDLTGSGIFIPARSQKVPDSYFLMRRSSDGYVSATGMFKAAYPWASKEEEQAERQYVKSLPATDPQEIAGNLWVPPEFALDLAAEYHITEWINALLDNEIIEWYSIPKSQEPPKRLPPGPKPIASPPHFNMPPKAQPNTRKLRATSREVRSESPMKMPPPPAATPGRPKKTPRKPRAKKVVSAAPTSSVEATPSVADSVADSGDDVENEAEAEADELSYEPNTESADAGAEQDQPEPEEEQDEEPLGDNNVRVSVQEEVKDDGHTTTTHTTVKVELPASSPDLKLPTDTEGVVEMAKNIIEGVKEMEAEKVEAAASDVKAANSRKNLKRSRDEYEEDMEDGPDEALEQAIERLEEGGTDKKRDVVESRPAKRAKLMVEAKEYRKEKVQKRALMGLSGALAFGLIIPAISAFWA